jgi:hypothetical protein
VLQDGDRHGHLLLGKLVPEVASADASEAARGVASGAARLCNYLHVYLHGIDFLHEIAMQEVERLLQEWRTVRSMNMRH